MSKTMPDSDFYGLFSSALAENGRDAFVSDWSLSSMWGDAETYVAPAERIAMLGDLWDAAHMSVRDIRKHTGLSQIAFCTRFCIPRRTLENWEAGVSACPNYLRLMLAQLSGAYVRP